MAVSGEGLGVDGPEADMWSQKLLVDAATEEGGNVNLKLFGIHVVDQVHKNFFRTAVMKVMDQEEDFFHNVKFKSNSVVDGFPRSILR